LNVRIRDTLLAHLLANANGAVAAVETLAQEALGVAGVALEVFLGEGIQLFFDEGIVSEAFFEFLF
jgi:hypothetical protein